MKIFGERERKISIYKNWIARSSFLRFLIIDSGFLFFFFYIVLVPIKEEYFEKREMELLKYNLWNIILNFSLFINFDLLQKIIIWFITFKISKQKFA